MATTLAAYAPQEGKPLWGERWDSNPRMQGSQPCALTILATSTPKESSGLLLRPATPRVTGSRVRRILRPVSTSSGLRRRQPAEWADFVLPASSESSARLMLAATFAASVLMAAPGNKPICLAPSPPGANRRARVLWMLVCMMSSVCNVRRCRGIWCRPLVSNQTLRIFSPALSPD